MNFTSERAHVSSEDRACLEDEILPHLCGIALHLQGVHRKHVFLSVKKGARIEDGGRGDVLQSMHDLVPTADIQIGLASGTFSHGCDDYAGGRTKRSRENNQGPTHRL
jgi:hypothetical protein